LYKYQDVLDVRKTTGFKSAPASKYSPQSSLSRLETMNPASSKALEFPG